MANKPVKQKVCKWCGDKFTPFQTTQKVCSTMCAIKLGQEKRVQDTEKKNRTEKKEYYRQKLSWQHKTTQPVYNRMRVLEELKWFADRNLTPTCISCGKPLGGDVWSCGHLRTRGAQGGLRYDRKNTFLQHSYSCNSKLSGDVEGSKTTRGYKNGLRERFGNEEGQAIIDYCETNTAVVHWTWQDLEEMRKKFNARIRELNC